MTLIEEVARVFWKPHIKCDLRNISNGPCDPGEECSCWRLQNNQAQAAIRAVLLAQLEWATKPQLMSSAEASEFRIGIKHFAKHHHIDLTEKAG